MAESEPPPCGPSYDFGKTYRDVTVVPGPSRWVRFMLWAGKHSEVIGGITILVLCLVFVFGLSGLLVWCGGSTERQIQVTANKTLMANDYSPPHKMISNHVRYQPGSGCFDKDWEVGAAAKHKNGKRYEVAMCCNEIECRIFSAVEY